MIEPSSRPARSRGFLLRAALVWLLLAPAAIATAAPPGPVVTFDTAGGDAWTFDKDIDGRFSAAACEGIVVHTPHATVEASLEDERFFARVPLRPDSTEVSAACIDDGAEVARTAPQRWNARLADVPKAWIRTGTSAQSIRLEADGTERAPATPAPIVSWRWRARAGNPAPLATVSGAGLAGKPVTGATIELAAPPVDGDYYVELTVTDALGRSDTSTAVFRVEDGRPENVDLAHEHPRWADSAVIYGIAPAFFGDPEFGQVTDRLDEIAELGATAIWLSPVMAAPEDDFGYAVLDPFRLRASFGDERAFRKLVDRAHALGLEVLMDFVPNHVSDRNRYFLDAEQDGAHSPYYDWFERDASGNVVRYFDWTHLKTLDYDNPEVQSYVIAAFAHWVRAYGVDGFRVDASWAVRRRAPEFWPRWRAELK
ncbi:MAG TPA: alpha-amylase family glycosyl hydrolase, partial [Woeseiaceae bacterium]